MAKNNKPFEWDDYKLISEIERHDKDDVIKVGKAVLKDRNYVDVRNFYLNKTTDELSPGKGIAIATIDDLPIQVAAAIILSYDKPEEALADVTALVGEVLAPRKKRKSRKAEKGA